MPLKRFKIEKLIRDRLPDLMRMKGILVQERAMDQNEFMIRLKEKLLEEAEEVKNAMSPEELAEELADLLEIIQSIAQATGLPLQQIEEIRRKKRESKGGFDRKIYTEFVELDAGNPAVHYYLKNPKQYPEIHDPKHQPDCLFCRIARREKGPPFFATFTHCYAIKDEFPVSSGHLLIVPKEHTENWFTAREEVRLDIMKALHLLKDRIDLEYCPHGYNIGANCGEVAGQSVMHLHLHLIPRYRGDMADPKGGVRGVIPSKQKY